MRSRCLAYALLATAFSCGGGAPSTDGTREMSGTLLFADTEGRVVVSNPATGRHREFQSPLGRPMGLSLSLDARQAAFGASLADQNDPHVVVMDVASGAMREIAPEPGQLAEFFWGGGGFFVYRSYSASTAPTGDNRFFVVVDGATKGRPLAATNTIGWFRASRYAAQIAYAQCSTGSLDDDAGCPMKLVVESAAGDTTQVLASGSGYAPLAFTPDGGSFLAIVFEPLASVGHLVRYEIATGASVDLGEADSDSTDGGLVEWEYEHMRGGWHISPDSQEVLVNRGAQTFAVKLDGSGERVVAEDATRQWNDRIVFAATGAVIYQVDVVTPTSADTQDVVSSLWVLQAGVRRQITTPKHCGSPVLSRSGHTAAWVCEEGLQLLSIDDASVRSTLPPTPQYWPDFEVLDADADDRGFVVASAFYSGTGAFEDYELAYLGSNGDRQSLGNARIFTTANGFKQGSSFAYRP